MSVDWPTLTLGEVCERITDGAHSSPKSVEDGKSMASVKDLTRFGVNLSEARLISKEDFEKLVKQGCQPKVGDVLIAKDGNSALDTVCTIDKPLDAVMLSSVAILRPNKEKLDSDFLKYYFCSKGVIDYLKSNFISGAAIPRIVLNDFRKAEIKTPPIEKQREISRVLRSLDNKIQLNRQTNQTLEQIAQAIFKSWFVDFEPTRAKIKAKKHWQAAQQSIKASSPSDYAEPSDKQHQHTTSLQEAMNRAAMAAISGKTEAELNNLPADTLQQLRTTAELFPDTLVESELGEIPAGWEVAELKACVVELRRGISPKYTEEGGIRVINQKCIRNHSINFELTRLNDSLKRKVEGRLIEVGDVLVNSTGVGTLGRLAPVRYLPEVMVFDSHVTVVRANTMEISKTFLAGLLLNKETFIEASGAGSTGQTELRKQVIEEICFAKPKLELGKIFDTIVEPINKQIAKFEQQQKNLVQIRDTLLPKLLSGELSATV
ncbi:restriction endonuclease subunit S [methanotrophic endosymbiont of Bathymodiolus puteoserpentis (Logatchev)]|jgi:type I restriction enzyme S subunit|uniref:restriction endonuclease subunit S n=1 Tax=methanotrophic endosymbiont of Bathymodiolus puteoserpentis (Logatchev) TaxID=343235 RepID=UPI0013C60117|nr:restriction endonuclease subunit S [methanotrophic endosymbiont of Bathymodiolus puteoserpentis (Logatchev)]SHE22900.1 Type I restriction-modification system, specificity subunit S [methanotrophic endosymbiont of Bathymodiolus puteoserpentis (Logatchev)]